MKFLRELVGFALVVLSWFNPFSFDLMVRILIFVLGFDLMSILPKLFIFVLDYLVGFSWLGFTLIILVAAEIVFILLEVKRIRLIVKPIAVFIVSFLSFGFQPALIVAGIDLLLNIGIGK
ncbi:MAG TPA: hypothetical protein VJ343_03410 [archaeon]|nr:hypothetical protein [archaeon]